MQRESLDREALAPALMHIEEQPANSLTVPQMAALCCLSPDHFARRFKAVIGQAPNEYLREQRVMRAAQMLLFSTKTLDEIADLCGFGSRHYLTRVFAQVMGVPPAAYRRGSDAGRPIYKEM